MMRYDAGMTGIAGATNGARIVCEQLALDLVSEPAAAGVGRHVLTRALRDHPGRDRIMRMLRIALCYFPELDGTSLKVGLARGAHGYASLEERTPAIWLNPRGLSYQTIAHELVHLLQARGLVPHGERSCDLYSLARDRVLVDAAPVYVRIPREFVGAGGRLRDGAPRVLHQTACEAIRRRSAGERQYIRWFEQSLALRKDLPALL